LIVGGTSCANVASTKYYGRRPSSSPSSSPTARSMARKIQEDWDFATDGKETFLYMFKNVINLVWSRIYFCQK